MNKDLLKTLQDKTYELEGLLMLILGRDDRTEALLPLVGAKIDELTALGKRLKDSPEEKETAEAEEDGDTAGYYDLTDKDVPIASVETSREPDYAGEAFERQTYAETAPRETRRRRPVFCINDRFRFKRELFNGSDAEFNDMLDKVAGMDSYEEAEHYFIAVKGLDPENETTADFLEILKTYYE